MRALLVLLGVAGVEAHAGDWATWRGPGTPGVSSEVGLVDPDPATTLWKADLPGGGTPVVWGDRVYAWGFRRGTGTDAWEVLAAFDLATGGLLWEQPFRDFLSDIVYERYSIGAPTVDRETGNVYVGSSAGELLAFAPDGTRLWTVSMMDAWGRLTFPNGRTGSPVIEGDLVLVHNITANWGREGPARDRFQAFDKRTGEAVWSSTPGTQPRDSSWGTPLVVDGTGAEAGRRIAITGTGCGHVLAIDARTGEPLWRFPMSDGGVNHSVVSDGRVVVAGHNLENLDSTVTGRMVAIDLAGPRSPATEGAPVLTAERWRRDLAGFSSSPVLHDGLVYQVTPTAELVALDLATGADVWRVRLGQDQLHASPVLADGKLYVPVRDGAFHVVEAGRTGGRILHTTKLAGQALGAPAIVDGRILVHTTEALYAFGRPGTPIAPVTPARPEPLSTAPAVSARARPAEVLLRPGERQPITVELLDAAGRVVRRTPAESAETFVPPGAKVVSTMNARFEKGALVAPADAGLTAGAWKVRAGGFEATTRGRTISGVPFREDFEGAVIDQTMADGRFGWPPLPWIGARLKWDVRARDGSQVLVKRIDTMLFQRAWTFLGHPEERDYVVAADVMSDGDRRGMSAVGLVNSRYLVALKANQRVLEVSSNQDRLKQSVPFVAEPGVWYRLVVAVDHEADGTSVVKGKAWKRGEPEPEAWTIVVRHPNGHRAGSPGVFGFTPNNIHRVYVDNLELTRRPGVPEAP